MRFPSAGTGNGRIGNLKKNRHLAGLRSDGASVMTGKRTGVSSGMAALQPNLVHVHCVTNRVALATKDDAS